MKKSKRAIVTSLSDTLTICISSEADLKTALERFALRLEETTGTKVDFCRIHGKRWAHFSGFPEAVIPEKRIDIGSSWGVIIENNTLTENDWITIGAAIPEHN